MSVITITVRPEQLGQLQDSLPGDMEIIKANIARRLKEQGPALITSMLGRWQTGKLASSLTAEVTSRGVTMMIGAGLDYADAVFFGAERHPITPGAGKRALHWSRFGTDYYYSQVDHPGQKARTDIFNALDELIHRIVEEEIRAVMTARSMAG